jgi:hypothetical protein
VGRYLDIYRNHLVLSRELLSELHVLILAFVEVCRIQLLLRFESHLTIHLPSFSSLLLLDMASIECIVDQYMGKKRGRSEEGSEEERETFFCGNSSEGGTR